MKGRVGIAKPASNFCKTRLPQKMEADGAAIQGGRKTGQARPCVQKKTLQEMHWGNQKEKHSIRADDRQRISRYNWRRFSRYNWQGISRNNRRPVSRNNWQGIRKRIIVVERGIMPVN